MRELMQYRSPDGFRPSGKNMPQVSVAGVARTSRASCRNWCLYGAMRVICHRLRKAGQPVPDSGTIGVKQVRCNSGKRKARDHVALW